MECGICGAEVKNPESYQHTGSKQHRKAMLTGDVKEFFELMDFVPRITTNYLLAGDTIVTLSIPEAKITEIPTMIDRFPILGEVKFPNNQITQIPEQVLNLKLLRILDLSHNEIETIPDNWSSLENLEELNLSYNKIQTIPAEIFRLPKLKVLNLSGNRVMEPMKILKNIENTTIKVLRIADMELTLLDDSILNLENLEKLDISKNKFDHIPPITAQLTQLKEISLTQNQISEIREGFFTENRFRVLSTLHLNENFLSRLPEDITLLRTLNTLGLGGNKFSEFPEHILDMNFKFLYLDDNDLASIPIELVNTYWQIISLKNNPRIIEINGAFSKFATHLFDTLLNVQPILEFQRKVCDKLVRDYIIEGKSVMDLLDRVKEDKWKEYIASKSSSVKELLVYRIMNQNFHQLVRDRIELLQESNPAMEELEVLIDKKIPHLSNLLELETAIGYVSFENRKIVGINLSDCGLNGFPIKLTLFPSLMALYLNDNKISKIPKEFGDMASIKLLSINNNGFKGFDPQMSMIPSLEGLSLSGNQYNAMSVDFSKFPNLTTLIISNCNIKEIPNEIIKLLLKLEHLDVSGNPIASIPPGLMNLKHLKSLNLTGSKVDRGTINIEDFENLESLKI